MKSVVVSGSKKYKQEIRAFCAELEKLGVLVFEPSIQQPLMESSLVGDAYLTSKLFKGLTLEHFDWIRKAEVCYIYNKDNYIGRSVTLELGYAVALGKPVFALNAETGDPCSDTLIDKVVNSPQMLAALL